MRMRRIEILQNFSPNPREIYLFGKKKTKKKTTGF